MAKRILVVDDEKNQRDILQLILSGERDAEGQPLYDIKTAASGQEALRTFKHENFDLVLTDLKMSGMDGIELLNEISQLDSSLPVILMTAHGSIETVKEALRGGAFDYLSKPLDRAKLLEVVAKAVAQMRAVDEEIIGVSEVMERVKKMIVKVAPSPSTVLIRGESGTGKERIARAIHKASPRAGERFQAVNCAAINENLLESELFGHEKGSFTGAHVEKKGLFEIADKGTLFLDEIGEINVSMQAKLLRVLQEKEVTHVGGSRAIKVDVRVLAATNRDLEAMVKDGRFREDLYYRLNVIPITVPPLRQRRDDTKVLTAHFLRKHSANAARPMKLSDDARRLILDYAWPGNVRQLESAIERALLLAEGDEITVEDLPVEIRATVQAETTGGFKLPAEGISFEELERSLLIQAMEQTGWNITRAAKLLGLSFRTMQYRLDKFEIKRPNRVKGGGEESEEDGQ
ncbi:MAG: sigma-54-dependent Fis family transcriptional regulator [Acidobacteria bacterium]|nr:sigma-54-dependent Fis family transcriptional regulator [Acidobacteriota bacterium]MBI3423159.1 sigma-54-dependent Fis family transcriptional regulator [Acidobacteriota bacterium]